MRTDDELLAAADGDVEAFAAFYRRHAAGLLGFFLRRTGGDRDAAGDLVAETFAAALEGCHRFRPARGDAAAWLYGIARHQLARRTQRGAVEDRARRRLGLERLAVDDASIARAEAADGAAVRALAALPGEQRDAVEARVVHDRDYADIAAEGGTTEAATRQRVSRGLAALRRRLQEDDR